MNKKKYIASTYSLIAAGAVLSVLSYYQWCTTEGCNRLHGTDLFGINLSVWGIVFFLCLGALTYSARSPWSHALRKAVLAGAVGAEATLLTIQWSLREVCLLCLGVSGVVFALGALELIVGQWPARSGAPAQAAPASWVKAAGAAVLMVAGLALGIAATHPLKTAMAPAKDTASRAGDVIPGVGKPGRYPIVRVYSDYFCPGCRQQEPVIDAAIDEALGRARIVFCDLPTHGAISRKYIAYFIACLLGENDGKKLRQARRALFELAGEKVQDNGRLEASLKECGVTLSLDRASIENCYRLIMKTAAADGVSTTPTVVVENKMGEKRFFRGSFTREELIESLKG